MTVSDGPVRDSPTHRVCVCVCQPTEEGRHLAVCVRPDGEVPVVGQDAIGQERIGCRWCASIMTRWNASKSASLPKRCSLPTDRFSTWYTCPPGAFRAAVGMGKWIPTERWPPSILGDRPRISPTPALDL